MDKKTSDIASGIGFFAFAACFWLAGRGQQGISRVFPENLELFLAAGGTLLIINGLRKTRLVAEGVEKIARGRVAAIAASSVIYALVIPFAGFYASSAAFLFIVSWAFAERGKGVRGWIRPAFFTLIMVVAVYLVFQYALSVPTPEGLLF
jgi:hypothetical protein